MCTNSGYAISSPFESVMVMRIVDLSWNSLANHHWLCILPLPILWGFLRSRPIATMTSTTLLVKKLRPWLHGVMQRPDLCPLMRRVGRRAVIQSNHGFWIAAIGVLIIRFCGAYGVLFLPAAAEMIDRWSYVCHRPLERSSTHTYFYAYALPRAGIVVRDPHCSYVVRHHCYHN